MTSESNENGFDELVRLSQGITNESKELAKKEQQRVEQEQIVQEMQHGLRGISVSVALEQLRLVATPEIIEITSSLTEKQDTEDLRKLITDLAHSLEKQLGSISATNPDMIPFERSVRTLSILIELFFSLR